MRKINRKKGTGKGHNKYKKEYAEQIIELAPTHSMLDIAVRWGVTRKSLDLWSRDPDKPEFHEPYIRAYEINLREFLEEGRRNLDNREYNSRLWESLYRVRYMNELRKMNADLKDFAKSNMEEKIQIVFNAMERGELKTSEVKELIETLRSVFDIEQGSQIKERVSQLEKKVR